MAVLSLGRGVAEGVCRQIQAFSGVLGEDDVPTTGTHEAGYSLPRSFVGIGRLFRKLVRPAMHRSVTCLVELALGIEDSVGFWLVAALSR
jgi:hypothetical protein